MIRRPPRSTLDRSSAASDVYKRQASRDASRSSRTIARRASRMISISSLRSVLVDVGADLVEVTASEEVFINLLRDIPVELSLIHISEPTRQAEISYAVFC